MGIYVGNMQHFQTLNPHKVKEFIMINEPFLRTIVKEEKKESKRGRPRIGEKWIIVALVIIGRIEGISWRALGEKLELCSFLIEEGWVRSIPSKSTFYRVWRSVELQLLEQWTTMLGEAVSTSGGRSAKALAIDSSGFKFRQSSLWRFVKWTKGALKRTSKVFRKFHIIISLPSKAIVSLTHSASNAHDLSAVGRLWSQLSSSILSSCRRVYADSAYWSENFVGLILQSSIFPVIPPKRNAVTHSPVLGPLVSFLRRYPGLYRHNHHPEYRSSVEHVFGLLKLSPPHLSDRLPSTLLCTFYCHFLCYNYLLLLRTLS